MKKSIYAMGVVIACACFKLSAKDVNVTINLNDECGEIKPLNGVNLGPTFYTEDAGRVNRAAFYELNVQSVRLHDVPLQNPGLKIVDTDLVFANFHADENDSRNYCFRPTDDYILASIAGGAKIVYRLGISIDHTIGKYRTDMPDPEKWAKICIKIIEHYNEGWANGFHHNIQYWEIWNEPTCKNASGKHTMWKGTHAEFIDFYCKTSKIIKERFPNLKIGGPSHVGLSGELYKPLLSQIKKTGAPLDFYSWHSYSASVEDIRSQPIVARKALDELGFANTELHLNEWHYFPLKWSELRSEKSDKKAMYERIRGVEAGVFATSVMSVWQDTPLTVANYYTAGCDGTWGIFNENCQPTKSYYPLKAFGEFVKYKNRISAKTKDKNVYALAAKKSDNSCAALISLFGADTDMLKLKCEGVDAKILSKAKVRICDDSKNFETAEGVKIVGDEIEIPISSKYNAILVTF